jgi:hypothetical protein
MELLFAFREFDRIAIQVTEYDKKVNAKKSEKWVRDFFFVFH